MKLVFALLTSALLLSASDPQTKKAAAAPAAKTIKPLEIPAGAVEKEPGSFYFTDAQGKKWIYRKTPFGVARLEDKPAAERFEAAATDPLANVKITVEGDLVRFERPGPFGVYKWQKKKSELDEKELAAVKKAQAASAKQD